jgi:UDP-N-acetylmuramate-alanine ligase
MMRNKITDFKSFYLIGIGGIGMSALARYFKSNDKAVFGYDRTPSTITDDLIKEGCKMFLLPRRHWLYIHPRYHHLTRNSLISERMDLWFIKGQKLLG